MKNKKSIKKAKLFAIFCLTAIAVFAGLYSISAVVQKEEIANAGTRLTYYEDGYTHSFIYNNKTYNQKPNITTVLVMGIDKFGKEQESETYINNYQSDFLALVVLDNHNKTAQLLHINRDTMAEVQTLSVTGENAGTQQCQIALAHTYGKEAKDRCQNTVKAVSSLLDGIKIDNYISMQMDAVPLLNDIVGGVTLPLLADFTMVNPNMTKGTNYTLMGNEALQYVRNRKDIQDSTNTARMERQKQYIYAFCSQLKNAAQSNEKIADSIFSQTAKYTVTDIPLNQINTQSQEFLSYTLQDIYSLQGIAKLGKSGYMEFTLKENAVYEFLAESMFE